MANLTPEQQIAAGDILRERTQKDIKSLQDEFNGYKAYYGNDPKVIASYTARIATLQRSLRDLGDQRVKIQEGMDRSRVKTYEEQLSGESRDAFLALKAVFGNYGLDSLAGKIFEYVKNGYSSDTVSLLLQDTPEYKERFAANEIRRKAGMSVLNPAEYLATENSYRQIMRQAGLPAGFYDTNSDFTNFLGGDVSPTELQDRVNLATQASTLANPAMKQALEQMGIGQGDVAAYFLDQKKAIPFIQKAAAKAAIGAEALQRGLQFDQQYAEELATSGISRDQAAQAYAKIGDEYSTLNSLGSIYGGGWTQRQAEEDIFRGGNEATAQKRRLTSTERGNFSGSAGTGRSGLSQRGGQR